MVRGDARPRRPARSQRFLRGIPTSSYRACHIGTSLVVAILLAGLVATTGQFSPFTTTAAPEVASPRPERLPVAPGAPASAQNSAPAAAPPTGAASQEPLLPDEAPAPQATDPAQMEPPQAVNGVPPGPGATAAVPTIIPPPISAPPPSPAPVPVPGTVPPPSPTFLPAITPLPSPTYVLIATPMPTPTLVATPTLAPALPVDLALLGSQSTVSVGAHFTVSVMVEAAPARPVDAVQVYLDFDPATLRVIGLRSGGTLEEQLQSSFDNSLGRIDFAAGTLGSSAVQAFTLVTVDFRAVAGTGSTGTILRFAPPAAPRATKVVQAGEVFTGRLGSLRIVVQ